MAQKVNYGAWTRYYIGRGLELLGLLLVLNGFLVSVQSPTLWPLLYASAAGISVFVFGWLLARKDPEKG